MIEDSYCNLPEDLIQELRRSNLLRTVLRSRVMRSELQTIELTEEEIKTARQGFLQQQKLQTQEAILRYRRRQGLSAEDLDWQMQQTMRVRRIAKNRFLHKAEAQFLKRKDQLDQVTYSILRTSDDCLARELHLRLVEGEATFAELAVHSEGPEKNRGGRIGPLPLKQTQPVLAELLRTSTPGTLHAPIRVAKQLLIVRLDHYEPASFDEKTANQMAVELFQAWVEDETSGMINRLQQADLPSPSP